MVYSEGQSFGKRSFQFFIKDGLVYWKDRLSDRPGSRFGLCYDVNLIKWLKSSESQFPYLWNEKTKKKSALHSI